MEPATKVAAAMLSGEQLVARVRHDLESFFPSGPPPGVDLTAVARQAVADLDGARVNALLPLLALRAAREALGKVRA